MKDYTKKRRYILVTCCLANLCLGSVYAWSVFASPMAEYLSQINGINITTGDLAIHLRPEFQLYSPHISATAVLQLPESETG